MFGKIIRSTLIFKKVVFAFSKLRLISSAPWHWSVYHGFLFWLINERERETLGSVPRVSVFIVWLFMISK